MVATLVSASPQGSVIILSFKSVVNIFLSTIPLHCNETVLLNNTFVVKQQHILVMRLTKEGREKKKKEVNWTVNSPARTVCREAGSVCLLIWSIKVNNICTSNTYSKWMSSPWMCFYEQVESSTDFKAGAQLSLASSGEGEELKAEYIR